MARTVAIGIQDFEQIIKNGCFYVDKTDFIREWWDSRDSVTLIARSRRFAISNELQRSGFGINWIKNTFLTKTVKKVGGT